MRLITVKRKRSGLGAGASALIAFALMFVLGPASYVDAGLPPEDTCVDAVERDYRKPLAGLPAIPHVPRSENLPFGPVGLKLRPLEDTVLVGESEFGYELWLERSTMARPVSLDWRVEIQLARLDRRGQPGRALAAKTQEVGTFANSEYNGKFFSLSTPAKPGRYLFQIVFRRASGAVLRRYAEYLRVVRPVFKARFRTTSSTYRPGEVASFWIENLGTKEVGLEGEAFVFEEFVNGRWIKAPGNPEAFYRIRLSPLSAGEAGFCRVFAIPPETVPGRYRFKKFISVVGGGGPRWLAVEFNVQDA
jgi:hypothetical protein